MKKSRLFLGEVKRAEDKNGKHEHEKVDFETYLEKVYDHALKMRKTFRESQKVKKDEKELKLKSEKFK
jgi:hypothetical protein